MNRKIRSHVFETNSSSVHSLVISNNGREVSNFKLNREGKIEVDFGDFGKELRVYTSQYDKLSYLITCLYYLSGYEVDDIYEKWEFENIKKAICEYTGATGIKILGKVEGGEIVPSNESSPMFSAASFFIEACWKTFVKIVAISDDEARLLYMPDEPTFARTTRIALLVYVGVYIVFSQT